MAAVSFNASGKRTSVSLKPANSTAAVIYTAPAGGKGSTIIGVNICSGASGDSATVMYNDGTTDWHLLTAKAVSANTSEEYKFAHVVLQPGYTLKVQAGTGNILTFTATLGEVIRDT